MPLITAVSACGAVGSAIAAGVYSTFSLRVMPRLATLPEADGITAMQRFNREAVQPPFMIVFFGTAVASVWKIVDVVTKEQRTTAEWLGAAGGALYLAGFILTVVYNVPRNRALDLVTPGTAQASQVWAKYLNEWTSANTVRAVMSAVGAVALGAGTVFSALDASGQKG